MMETTVQASEGTDDDNASAKDDMRALSGGLSSDVAAVADKPVQQPITTAPQWTMTYMRMMLLVQ
jgi:hypothetical protein